MKRIVLYTLNVAVAILCMKRVKAQVDPHFTQYYIHTSWLNPALTGLFDGDYRVAGIYRNQWGNMGSPFSTIGASAEKVTDKNINLGLNVINQKAGDGGYSYTTGIQGYVLAHRKTIVLPWPFKWVLYNGGLILQNLSLVISGTR
jgi:hypothetical protein